MNIDLQALAATHNLRKGNGRWSGPCPKCGGSSTSDKFVMRDDGGFKCHACEFKGDIITWLREIDGKTCPEAHEAAGMDCRFASCPAKGTCRLGDGSGRTVQRARSVAPTAAKRQPLVPVVRPKGPADIWRAWASALVDMACLDLREQPEQLAWLASRGIDADSVRSFELGWMAHDRRVVRAAIGLQPKEGKDKLWVPGGLVIPIYTADGKLHRIRIRRTPESRERFAPDRKYLWIEGSGNEPLVIRPSAGQVRGVVVVEAELDAMAVAAAHDGVMVIAVGTVGGGLPEWLRADCEAAPVILVALDADPGKDGKTGAGPQWITAWTRTYRQARFWPTPAGKDPGDYVRDHGGDLRAWVEAGLPPAVVPAAPAPPAAAPVVESRQDLLLSLDAGQRGEGGKAVITDARDADQTPAPSPMAEFIGLLATETGWIARGEHDLHVRYQVPQPATVAAMHNRELITAALYGGGEVAHLLELLPLGNHGHRGLELFFKGVV